MNSHPVFDIAQDELQILLAETDEQLQVLDEGLVQLERDGNDTQLLQAIFRAAHTLKGNAGIINHWRMADLTHALETVLDALRKGQLAVSTDLVDAGLEALDALKLLHGEILSNTAAPIEIAPLITRLLNLAPPEVARPVSAFVSTTVTSALVTTTTGSGLYICAEIAPNSIAPAARALQVVLALQTLGAIDDLQPPQHIIESAAPVRRVTAYLTSDQPLAKIRRALSNISDLTYITIGEETIDLTAPLASPTPAPTPVTRPAPAPPPLLDLDSMRLGEILMSAGHLTQAQLQATLDQQTTHPENAHILGRMLMQAGLLTQETLDWAILQQTQQLRAALQAAQLPAELGRTHTAEKTIRTSVERLDKLMNLVGELITDRNRLLQIESDFEKQTNGAAANGAAHTLRDNLSQTVVHVGRITDQLQEEVMRIRLLPVANVFNKFPRLVRDLARKAGKQVELVLRGEDTELDRSVIEEISDPLLHLLRNSVAHGLELPHERLAAGKAERGTITVTARHEESRIILTVEDDGLGIDVARVRASAVRKNLITEADAAQLTTAETIDLIFLPGLSTAETIDGVSGRGVGMDIVRTNIERLNGNILVETWPGRGTRFQVLLPLTLATVSTLLVVLGENTLALPLMAVMETLRLPRKDIQTIQGRWVTRLRDHVLPLVHLSALLNLAAPDPFDPNIYHYIVAVRWGALEMGLVVDRLIGEQELVVKSMGPLIGDTPGISGAAILGDGRVALIVDVPGLFKLAGIKEERYVE